MAGTSLVPALPLFEDQVAKALRIFKRLRIPDIPGTPTMAEACGEWVFPLVAAIFGAFDPETKRRLIQEFFLLVPKGNSKTSYGGAIMVVALILMPIVVLTSDGGSATVTEAVRAVDPAFLSLFHGLTVIGFLSAVTWGLGYFGQPHIIVRFMAVKEGGVKTARNIGMSWMFVSLIGALGVGILGRAHVEINNLTLDDPETIFILLADTLFHPLITGFLLAALLAAIMSTISSQLLVASSSLTEDFYRLFLRKQASERETVNVSRVCVLLVALAAIAIAADPNSEVLGLVSNAWAGFGAAFGPLIILALTWDRMTGSGAVAGLVTGAAVVIAWIALGFGDSFLGGPGVYEIIPGFIASWGAIVLVSRMGSSAPVPRAATQ